MAADSGHARYGVDGALHLWILHADAGDLRAADQAYRRAVELFARDKDESIDEMSVGLGSGIAAYRPEFVRHGRPALHLMIESTVPETASIGALGLAGLELQMAEEMHGSADRAAMMAALHRVLTIGHPDYVPAAAHWLAFISSQTGDVDAARAALRAAMDSGDRGLACRTALDAGEVFRRTGHLAEAITALRFVVDDDPTGRATIAAKHLGELLAQEGDVEGARAAYQVVLDKSTFPHVIAEARAALDRL